MGSNILKKAQSFRLSKNFSFFSKITLAFLVVSIYNKTAFYKESMVDYFICA